MKQNPLQNYACRLEPYLKDFFKQQIKELPAASSYSRQLLKNIQEFCLRGGKRLRAALVYDGAKLFKQKDSEEIFKASLIPELVHAFLLIHDDIMDQDKLRRGGLTMHQLYKKEALNLKPKFLQAQHFGESLAILAGDLAYVLALKILLSLKIESRIKQGLWQKINDTVNQTIWGQTLDIWLSLRSQANPKEILDVYYLKTAQYSFEAPLHLGAMMAGVPPCELPKLSAFALPCGLAFQIKDDILGMFGNQKTTGKSRGADLKQGKQTLLIVYALKKGTKVQQQKIQTALGNKKLSSHNLAQIRSLIKDSGSLSACENLAKKYVNQAKKALIPFQTKKYNQSIVKELSRLADFIIARKA